MYSILMENRFQINETPQQIQVKVLIQCRASGGWFGFVMSSLFTSKVCSNESDYFLQHLHQNFYYQNASERPSTRKTRQNKEQHPRKKEKSRWFMLKFCLVHMPEMKRNETDIPAFKKRDIEF